jgi:agarase
VHPGRNLQKFILISLILLFLLPSFSVVSNNEKCNFFRVEYSNDHWKFIDPNGNPFFSTGICGIRANGAYAPDLGYSPYYDNITKLYGDEEGWANVTHERLIEWGINTLGSGSDKYIIAKGLPYTVNLHMAGAKWQIGEVVDFFSDEFIDRTEKIGRETCKNLSNDQNLIGYFLDNELHWGSDWRSLLDLFDSYMQFSYDSKGKNALVNFLKDRYNQNIDAFNIAWRTNLKSFDEILNQTFLGIWPYTTKARSDHFAFNYHVAEQYFKTCYNSIKKYDTNHLILGARFQSWLIPTEVVEACKDYVDVITINHYFTRPTILPFAYLMTYLLNFVEPTRLFQEFYDIINKPILVSEFNFRAKDSGLPNTQPSPFIFPVVRTQKIRAICFEIFAQKFIEKPYSVGYHWFCYIDEPETGRFDGEDSNTGVVNVRDEPYIPLVDSFTKMNKIAQEKVQ